MPKENELEGRQDMGGKHGGQAGMPKPSGTSSAQQGIVKGEQAQEQSADKAREIASDIVGHAADIDQIN